VDPSQPTVTFPALPFLRCDYSFHYVSSETSAVLGSLTVPSTEPPSTPKQIHLNLVDDAATTINVQYVSKSATVPSVRFGTSQSDLVAVVTGFSATYGTEDFCDKRTQSAHVHSQTHFIDPGYTHSVPLTGLTPDTRYFYQVGNDETGFSRVLTFRTAPVPGPGSPVRFVAFGDQDLGEAAHNTSLGVEREILENDSRFTLHFGDLGYALGVGRRWDQWSSMVEKGAALAPYLTTVGNHEINHVDGTKDVTGERPFLLCRGSSSKGECGVPFLNRMNNTGTVSPYYYSFGYGNVYVIQMSSEHSWMPNSKQHKWLVDTLKSVDRDVYPWLIVTLHRPIYTTQQGEGGDYAYGRALRLVTDPLFHEYKVNLALTAHTHSYERTCEVMRGACVEKRGYERGTTHIVVGSAGAGLEAEGFSPVFGRFSEAHINAWGYLRLDSGAGESGDQMKLEFVLDANATVFDTVLLDKWE
jgi:hypothetical protein